MKKFLRNMLLILSLLCCAMFLWQFFQGNQADDAYDTVAELAFSKKPEGAHPAVDPKPAEQEQLPPEQRWVPAPVEEEDPNMELLKDIDLEALREINPDVIGWILIPDSKINYPVMQGTDNEYYLKHTWEKKKNIAGSVFLEHRSSPDLTDFNTIVYGHNMNNGSMFGSLRKYSNKKYLESHPYVYIVSDQGVYRYEIFSFYKAPVDSLTYAVEVLQDSTRERFLKHAQQSALRDTGVAPEITDRILTLSTCSGGGYSNRWVVQARLKMVQETVEP